MDKTVVALICLALSIVLTAMLIAARHPKNAASSFFIKIHPILAVALVLFALYHTFQTINDSMPFVVTGSIALAFLLADCLVYVLGRYGYDRWRPWHRDLTILFVIALLVHIESGMYYHFIH